MRLPLAALALVACHSVVNSGAGTTPEQPSRSVAASPGAARAAAPQIVLGGAGGAVQIHAGAPHLARSIDVGNGVALEVLDWGGEGLPIVLSSGLGNSAHIFDDLASAFLDRWRVIGVSRRGFGGSTIAESGYDVPQLGADLLRVLDALEVPRAIFVGHSVAGEELTWLGREHSDRVSALVYLDAAYDRVALRGQQPPSTPEPPATASDLASPLGYAAYLSRGMGMPIPLDEVHASFQFAGDGHFVGLKLPEKAIQQIIAGQRAPDYSGVKAPTLALYALADHWPRDYAAFAASERDKLARALPSARIRAIPHAKHYLFLTHRADVVREIREFLAEPPRSR